MTKTLLLLAEGFEFYEASVFIDVLGWNKEEGDGTTVITTCGPTKEVKSTFGQKLISDITLNQVDVSHFDALAIPGGFEQYGFYESAFSEPYQQIIKEFNQQQKPIASICTGAIPIAKAGILNNKSATTYFNAKRTSQLSNLGANYQNNRIVQTENIITSQNPSTALDVAFLLLEKLTNKENCNHVKKLMGL